MSRSIRHFVVTAVLFSMLGSAADAATITVNSSGDSIANDGSCSLREAITAANGNLPSGAAAGECAAGAAVGQDQIFFAISGAGPHTLQPAGALPDIVSSLVINGYTQPGASANTLSGITQGFDAQILIRIDGSQSGALTKPGLNIVGPNGSSSVIRGLEIFAYNSPACCADSGIAVSGQAQNVVIAGNILRNSGSRGVMALGSGGGHQNLRIGGPLAADRNLIYAQTNGEGISLSDCQNCVIENNWIGLSRVGSQAIASGNLVGIHCSNSAGLQIRDNWIAGNLSAGVVLTSVQTQTIVRDNLIGGSFPNGRGIFISSNGMSGPNDNLIKKNIVTGNNQFGIGIISFSAGAPVLRNSLRGNRVYANGGVEIDLGGTSGDVNGITPNDVGDVDTGPNGIQNFPVLGPVQVAGSSISIPYAIDSADVLYALEFSFSSLCDASGNGPAGQMQRDPVELSGMQAIGTATFQLPAVAANGFVTATATGPDGTSEFSACRAYVFVDNLLTNGFE